MSSEAKKRTLQFTCTELYKTVLPSDLAKEIVDWASWNPWFIPEARQNPRWHKKYRTSAENSAIMHCDPTVHPKSVLMLKFNVGDEYRVNLKMRRAQTAPEGANTKHVSPV